MNIKNFDIVFVPPVGLSSFTHSIFLPSMRTNRKEKIKRIFNI